MILQLLVRIIVSSLSTILVYLRAGFPNVMPSDSFPGASQVFLENGQCLVRLLPSMAYD